MQISKKVALMAAAAAGTMVVGGAGSASAFGLFPTGDGVRQSNSCDTRVGDVVPVNVAAPTGDIDLNPDCVNFTNSHAAYQSNDCDTATGIIAPVGGAAPTSDLDIGPNCANIAVGGDPVVVVHQDPPKKQKEKAKHSKAKKHTKAKKHGKSTKVKVKTHKTKH
ncbi:hypothetical protein [Streptomyces sp. NPDC021212]|uniref:hypothetical protein n=1 Tax=Streptomyces sp. NPDC021212 TaxID=3365118 RepID=UPI00379457D4